MSNRIMGIEDLGEGKELMYVEPHSSILERVSMMGVDEIQVELEKAGIDISYIFRNIKEEYDNPRNKMQAIELSLKLLGMLDKGKMNVGKQVNIFQNKKDDGVFNVI